MHRLRASEAPLTTILLVDDDETVVTSVKDALGALALDIIAVGDHAVAMETLQSKSVDVLLIDEKHETVNGTSLIEAAQRASQRVTTIVMMSAATVRQADEALDRGVATIVDKPFTNEDLVRAYDRAVSGERFRGDLSGISLLDLFQVFNLSRRSLVVRIGGVPPSRVWFENGEIVHAECGDVSGEDVLEKLVDVRTGAIRTLPFSPAPRTVDRIFHSLLLDILRARDESKKHVAPPAAEAADDIQPGDDDFTIDDEGPTAIDMLRDTNLFESEPSDPLPFRPDDDDPGLPAPEDELAWSARTVLPQRKLDPICVALTAEVPHALATALVDLASGQLLGMHNTAEFTPAFERFIALYVRALFRGPEIQHIERTVQEQRGLQAHTGYLEEVVLTSKHTHHLTKTIHGGDVALMIVTPRRVPPETTWATVRALVPGVETNLS